MRTGTSRQNLLVAAALCALTLAAHSNCFTAGFVFDNKGLLLADPRIREASAENLGLIVQHTYWWPYGESGLYRPFATLSYLFNYAVLGNGEHPAGYHWINFLLHLGNVLLVYAIARRLLDKFWPPVFVAALWAVHPVLTESVTNIVGRVDLLAAMAVLSGFLFYLNSTEASGKARWMWLAALMAVTFAGVFSKESAVMILGVIVLYELVWWKERRNLSGLLLGCAAIAPPLLAMWLARSVVMAGTNGPEFPFVDNPLVAADFWTARLTALKVLARYLGLLVWPARLSADYSYAEIPLARGSASDWAAWLIVAIAVAGVIAFRRNRVVLFVVGFAAAAILPTANLLFPIGTIMAERFLYLPAIALAVCVVIASYALLPKAAPIAPCSGRAVRHSHLGTQYGLAGRFDRCARHRAHCARQLQGARVARVRLVRFARRYRQCHRGGGKEPRPLAASARSRELRAAVPASGAVLPDQRGCAAHSRCRRTDGHSSIGAAGLPTFARRFGAMRLHRTNQQRPGESAGPRSWRRRNQAA